MKSLARYLFLKKNFHAGIDSIIGAWTIPEHIYGMAVNNDKLLNKTKTSICSLKKEVRIACPQLRLAPMNNMDFLGRGKHRYMESKCIHVPPRFIINQFVKFNNEIIGISVSNIVSIETLDHKV